MDIITKTLKFLVGFVSLALSAFILGMMARIFLWAFNAGYTLW